MADSSLPRVLTLFGPTAIGKTSIAIELADRLNGEIVSCDSRQVFKFLDIGTAKPTPAERDKARFHLVDIVPPDHFLNAYCFRLLASDAIRDILEREKTPIMTVGTGMYLKALTDGIFEAPDADQELRSGLEKIADTNGLEALHRRLADVDPEAASALSINDRVRIIRALELYNLSGKTRSELQDERQLDPLPYSFVFAGLSLERKALYDRIDRRCEEMLESGLITEAKSLRENSVLSDSIAAKVVGYSEAYQYLDKLCSLEEMMKKFKQATRNYAKRQLTWFRKHPGTEPFDIRDNGLIDKILEQFWDA